MDIYLRFVEEEDAKVLFDWRTDPVTKKHSRNTDDIQYESHLIWLRDSLRNPVRNMFMAIDDEGNRIGQIRFDRDGSMAEIDIAVSPAMRGKGIGRRLLKKGCQSYLNNWDVDYLLAAVKKNNFASIRIFEEAGFDVYKEDDDMVRMRLYR